MPDSSYCSVGSRGAALTGKTEYKKKCIQITLQGCASHHPGRCGRAGEFYIGDLVVKEPKTLWQKAMITLPGYAGDVATGRRLPFVESGRLSISERSIKPFDQSELKYVRVKSCA